MPFDKDHAEREWQQYLQSLPPQYRDLAVSQRIVMDDMFAFAEKWKPDTSRKALTGWANVYGLKRRWCGLEPNWMLKRRLANLMVRSGFDAFQEQKKKMRLSILKGRG